MRALILGGGGFLGRKLAGALAARGSLRGAALTRLAQVDLAAPEPVSGAEGLALDITDRAAAAALLGQGWDAVFHLAAVVSGQAEAELETGLSVNLQGSLNVLEGARAAGGAPVLVFASSVAVYGGDVPDPLHDFVALQPQTSYGAQKAAVELLVSDYARRGLIDGRSVRLPTVTVRPGKPNAAASSFMSSIFREPLQGQSANCPVGEDYPIWHCSPRVVIRNLIHAAEVDGAALGATRAFALPGRRDTVGEMIAAMTRVAGPEAATRITWERDPVIERIVMGWRAGLQPDHALRLGFVADASFEDNIRGFLEDDIAA